MSCGPAHLNVLATTLCWPVEKEPCGLDVSCSPGIGLVGKVETGAAESSKDGIVNYVGSGSGDHGLPLLIDPSAHDFGHHGHHNYEETRAWGRT